MHVSAAALDDVAAIQRCLGASGMLVHHRRCYEDSALVTLADVEDLLVRPGLCTWLLQDGAAVQAVATTSVGDEDSGRVGYLHLFVVRPDASSHTAVRLLQHLLGQWLEPPVALIRQARLDPLSSVFRIEQDRALLDLFASCGFEAGEVTGNMQTDAEDFRWNEHLQDSVDGLAAHAIRLRSGRADDLAGLRALHRAEGLSLWDTHLDATRAAGQFEPLQIAERNGQIIGYANFFAGRWQSALPEFGPMLVSASERGQGMGRVLAARALQYAQAHGKRRLRLSTRASKFDFYRALGFEVALTWHEQLHKVC